MNKLNKKIIVGAVVIVIAIVFVGFKNRQTIKDLFGKKTAELNKEIPSGFKVPEGFEVFVFAKDLGEVGAIVFDSKGRMLVSQPSAGKIIAVENGKQTILLEGLRSPFGMAFYTDKTTKTDYLYVAETQQVARYKYDVKNGAVIDKVGKNIVNLPADGLNIYRDIAFGPNYQVKPLTNALKEETMNETKLYISVGSSCEACVEDSWKRGAILESDPDGSYTAELAGGLRNSLFFDFNPTTKQIWATEIGRGDLGLKIPPDEINIIKPGKKYGWPFCYGKQIKDSSFKPAKINRTDIPQDCNLTQPSVIEFPAHSAPLGLAFVSSDGWPKEWQGSLLVAYRNALVGGIAADYKIARFAVDKNGKVSGTTDFLTGLLSGGKTNNRLIYLKFGPDGALYVSDNASGKIYKIVSR